MSKLVRGCVLISGKLGEFLIKLSLQFTHINAEKKYLNSFNDNSLSAWLKKQCNRLIPIVIFYEIAFRRELLNLHLSMYDLDALQL